MVNLLIHSLLLQWRRLASPASSAEVVRSRAPTARTAACATPTDRDAPASRDSRGFSAISHVHRYASTWSLTAWPPVSQFGVHLVKNIWQPTHSNIKIAFRWKRNLQKKIWINKLIYFLLKINKYLLTLWASDDIPVITKIDTLSLYIRINVNEK